eukprot:jgi/Chlat1/416/Chrsp10S01515
MHVQIPKNDKSLQVVNPATTRNIGGDAFEILVVNNNAKQPQIAPITIEWVAGVKPKILKYVVDSAGLQSGPVEFITNSATCYGHPATTGSVAVGAVNYQAARAYTGKTSKREYFSSPVGTPVLFTDAGRRLPKQRLVKNLIMAPDGIDTTFFPASGADTNGDKRPEFLGTSAAAPNAAAVAALLFGTSPRGLTVDAVVSALYSTAEDMDDPRTSKFDRGFDYATGYGMINATRAAEKFNIFACRA